MTARKACCASLKRWPGWKTDLSIYLKSMLKSGLRFQPAERAGAAHVICAFGAMVLALIAGGFQPNRGQSTELKTIRVLNYENARPDAAVFLAFDDSHAYLATPDGLFRTTGR